MPSASAAFFSLLLLLLPKPLLDFEASLRTALDDLSPPPSDPASALVLEARKDLQQGRPWRAAERLGAARFRMVAAGYLTSRAGWEKKSPEVFEEEWRKVGKDLADRDQALERRLAVSSFPEVIRGWIQGARARSKSYHDAGIGFLRSGSAAAGYQSIGTALGSLARAESLAGLSFAGSTGSVAPPELHPFLDDVERRLGEAYASGGGQATARLLLQANATLGFARKLKLAGRTEGAAIQLLEATRLLGEATLPVEDPENLALLAEAVSKNANEKGDDSIATYYLEVAREAMSRKGSRRKSGMALATAVLGSTLPLWHGLRGGETPAVPVDGRGDGVRVTLVRWPYT